MPSVNKNSSLKQICLVCDYKTVSLTSLVAHFITSHAGPQVETLSREIYGDHPEETLVGSYDSALDKIPFRNSCHYLSETRTGDLFDDSHGENHGNFYEMRMHTDNIEVENIDVEKTIPIQILNKKQMIYKNHKKIISSVDSEMLLEKIKFGNNPLVIVDIKQCEKENTKFKIIPQQIVKKKQTSSLMSSEIILEKNEFCNDAVAFADVEQSEKQNTKIKIHPQNLKKKQLINLNDRKLNSSVGSEVLLKDIERDNDPINTGDIELFGKQKTIIKIIPPENVKKKQMINSNDSKLNSFIGSEVLLEDIERENDPIITADIKQSEKQNTIIKIIHPQNVKKKQLLNSSDRKSNSSVSSNVFLEDIEIDNDHLIDANVELCEKENMINFIKSHTKYSDISEMPLKHIEPSHTIELRNQIFKTVEDEEKLTNLKKKPHFDLSKVSTKDCLKQYKFKDSEYQCVECRYTTKLLYNLRRHGMIHTDYKPYKCDMCAFKTRSNYKLRKHKEVHTSKKNTCKYCHFGTKSRCYLKIHEWEHTDKSWEFTPEIRRKCNVWDIGVHLNVTFHCDQCIFVTTNNRNLKLHKKKHLKKNQLHCEQCDFTSIKASHLKKHIWKVHKGILFRCDPCDFQTRKQYELKCHQLEHKK